MHSYLLQNILNLTSDEKIFTVSNHGQRFVIGEMAIHVKDNINNLNYWFVFKHYENNGAYYQLIYKTK